MSMTYTYYLGYIKDNTLYPLGPFDKDGDIKSIPLYTYDNLFSEHDYFKNVDDDCKIDKRFDDYFEGIYNYPLYYTYIEDLPKEDYIYNGYFPQSNVIKYLESDGSDVMTEVMKRKMLPDEIFAAKALHEIKSGKTNGISCKDYVYFSVIDKYGIEYFSNRARCYTNLMLRNSNNSIDISEVVLVMRII